MVRMIQKKKKEVSKKHRQIHSFILVAVFAVEKKFCKIFTANVASTMSQHLCKHLKHKHLT